MADFPALPVWTDAFLADTTHLLRDEIGAYLLLLMTAWRRPSCSLPDDDAYLARIARCDTRTWRSRMRPLMLQFWKIQDGEWTQKRLTAEREYVNKRAAVSRTNGMRGGRPNPNNNKDLENPAGTLEETREEPTHTHTHIDSVGDKSPPGAVAPEAPDKPVFDRGRQLLGKSAGGQIKKLIAHHGGDLDATMRTLERAAGKSNPSEWVGAILRGERSASADAVAAETDALYRRLGVLL